MDSAWGIGLSLLAALAAWTAGRALPVIGGPVFGILFGMVLAFWKRPPRFQKGIQFSSKKLLQAAIVLLGFEMDLASVARTGAESLLVLVFTLLAAFLAALFLSRFLRVGGRTAVLIGVGTAICGGSAIAAVSPIVEARDEEVAHAISTIFLFNVVAVFLFPFLGRLLGLSDHGFGLWAGTAINDTSSVVAAGYSYSDAAGSYATIVKLTRTLLIIPVCLVLAFAKRRRAAPAGGAALEAAGTAQDAAPAGGAALEAASAVGGAAQEAAPAGGAAQAAPAGRGGAFSFAKVFPWFVLGFLLASVARTTGLLPAGLPAFLGASGKFLIIVAMSAIGLNTNLVRLLRNGARPIALGLGCWAAVALVSLAVQRLAGGW
jgi:uncharacterized membrane protein YadS